MPYTYDNPPDGIKSLPKGAQRIYIDTFNAVVRDGGSEDSARQAAWRNVKKEYKKVGDKWVKKEGHMDTEDKVTENKNTNNLLVETIESPVYLDEQTDGRKNRRMTLLCSKGDFLNNNRRVYPMSIWQREVARVQEDISAGRFIGLADHPGFLGASVDRRVLKYEDIWIGNKDGPDEDSKEIWGTAVIPNTQLGKDIIAQAEVGMYHGASTRGTGTTKTAAWEGTEGVQVVQEDYRFEGVDLVIDPSVKDAGVYVFEAKVDNKTTEADMELQEMLDAAQGELEEAKRNIQEIQEELDRLKAELGTKDKEILGKVAEIEELSTEISEKDNEVSELQGRLEEVTTSLEEVTTSRDALQSLSDARSHLLSLTKGHPFAVPLIRKLFDKPTVEEITAAWERTITEVEKELSKSPIASSRAIFNGTEGELEEDKPVPPYMNATNLPHLRMGGLG